MIRLILIIATTVLALATRIIRLSNRINKKIASKLPDGKIIYSTPARHFNVDLIEGNLYLYEDKLLYISAPSKQTACSRTVLLSDLQELRLNEPANPFQRGIETVTYENVRELFVVSKREQWKEQIEKQLKLVSVKKLDDFGEDKYV
ncbi:MAG: hypothetical protein IAF38_04700 [Bacteroidia bacterium]|nr:hypothetical protein [Bacteroidia bacterium]